MSCGVGLTRPSGDGISTQEHTTQEVGGCSPSIDVGECRWSQWWRRVARQFVVMGTESLEVRHHRRGFSHFRAIWNRIGEALAIGRAAVRGRGLNRRRAAASRQFAGRSGGRGHACHLGRRCRHRWAVRRTGSPQPETQGASCGHRHHEEQSDHVPNLADSLHGRNESLVGRGCRELLGLFPKTIHLLQIRVRGESALFGEAGLDVVESPEELAVGALQGLLGVDVEEAG